MDGGTSGYVDRRRVSVQWFAGTILTALCGAALMGGAVFTSLDGETNFASLPERVEVALRGAIGVAGDKLGVSRKSDRLPTAEEPTYARHVIRVSTIARVGNHEVVRVRPFVRVAGNLSLTISDLSAGIPPFNPQRMLAESAPGGGTAADDAPPAAQPDAEVAFVMRDLDPMMANLKIALLTPQDEVIARVREAAEWSAKAGHASGLGRQHHRHQARLCRRRRTSTLMPASRRASCPRTSRCCRRPPNETTGGNGFNEKTIAVKKGDSVSTMLRDLGATPDEIGAIAKVLGPRGRDGGVKEGQKLRVLLSPVPGGQRLQPIRVIVASDAAIEAVVALADTGKYVAVDVKNVDTEVADSTEDSTDDTIPAASASIKASTRPRCATRFRARSSKT